MSAVRRSCRDLEAVIVQLRDELLHQRREVKRLHIENEVLRETTEPAYSLGFLAGGVLAARLRYFGRPLLLMPYQGTFALWVVSNQATWVSSDCRMPTVIESLPARCGG
jgi:hypothetical protein